MNPEEKAKELYQKFYNAQSSHSIPSVAFESAKTCAIIAVEEIIKYQVELIQCSTNTPADIGNGSWLEVYKELKKL